MAEIEEFFSVPGDSSGQSLRIAVEGCGHGTLNKIYTSITSACRAKSWPGVDLLIIGGDFQAVRNSHDMNAMSVPVKYREIGDFHEYYSGKRVAPYLTIFIGGNHEASNHCTELYYGGWVAPNIYYLGAANVIKIGGLRIAGMSGIWKGYDYRKGHFERLPYKDGEEKSVYHVRELDVRKLLQVRTQVDIGLSHDWPEGIQWCGDSKKLWKDKPFLKADADSGRLGNPAAKYVLDRLRPRYWFSAHLHARYTALVKHGDGEGNGVTKNESGRAIDGNEATDPVTHGMNTKSTEEDKTSTGPVANFDEIDLDLDDEDGETAAIDKTANPDEIDLDLDSEDTAPTIQDGAANPDEIDLELDDEDTAPTATNSAANPEEIDIELVDGETAPTAADSRAKPDKINLEVDSTNHTSSKDSTMNETYIAEDILSQLPDSFKPAPPPEKLPFPSDIKNTETKFLALDKCLPHRHFLQLLEIPLPSPSKIQRPVRLEYDEEWLAITRVFANSITIGKHPTSATPRDEGEAIYRDRILAEEEWVKTNLVEKGKMQIPENFVRTAPVYDPAVPVTTNIRPLEYENPQTSAFCELLGIRNPLDMSQSEKGRREAETRRLNEMAPPPTMNGGGHRGGGGNRGRGRGRGGRGGRGRGR